MQINSVFSGYPDPTTFGLRHETAEPAGESSVEKSSVAAAGADSIAAVRDILADYDVTDIAPRQLSEMLQRLHKSGALTEDQFQELSLIRLDLDAQGASPDEPIDLIDFYGRRLEKLQRDVMDGRTNGPQDLEPRLDAVRQWLAWLEKFAMVRSAPDDVGFSAIA